MKRLMTDTAYGISATLWLIATADLAQGILRGTAPDRMSYAAVMTASAAWAIAGKVLHDGKR